MARSLSSMKRMRQNEKRAAKNKVRKTLVKNAVRAFKDAVTAKDTATAEKTMREAAGILDRNSLRHALHRNTAARRKSRMAKRLNALKAAKA